MTSTDHRDGPAEQVDRLGNNRDWRLLWSTGAISSLGTAATTFALPLTLLAVTGSLRKVTLVLSLGTVSALATSALGGALVDRSDKKHLIIATHSLRLAATLALALLFATGVTDIWWFASGYVVISVATALFNPASGSLLRSVVPPHQRSAAAGLNQARQGTATILGPPVGAALMGAARYVPFLADAATYLVALVGALLVKTPCPPSDATRKAYLAEVWEGLAYCARSRLLSRVILFAFLANFAFGVSFLVANLDLARHGLSAATISTIDMVAGAATVAGSLSVLRLRAMFAAAPLVAVCIVISLTGFCALIFAGHRPVLVAMFLGLGMLPFPVLTALIFGAIMNAVDSNVQGRVGAAGSFASTSLAAVAPAAGGWGLSLLSVAELRVTMLTVLLIAFVPLLQVRRLLGEQAALSVISITTSTRKGQ